MSASLHKPVLARETLEGLRPRDKELFVDGTFGAGGISRAILESADCAVIAIDRDPAAIARGASLAQEFTGRFELIHGRFGAMGVLLQPALARAGRSDVDGVTLDLGVSSPQLDDPSRGFSFQSDGPLDMRMSGEGRSAADIVNHAPESEIERIIRAYGEERHARRIAQMISNRRASEPFERTLDLARSIEKTVRKRPGDRIHPATRTFQALRIAVNEELKDLALGLSAAERLLREAGRMAVVSFHSLEDRIVKLFLAERSKPKAAPSRHLPLAAADDRRPSFSLVTRQPIVASPEELADNPRARSAKLRVAARTGEQPIPLDLERLGIVEIAP